MKKLAGLFVGLIIFGFSVITVSADSYEVNKGDTLWDIAIENNTTVEDIMELNELKSTVIHPKQELEINENEIEYYIVEKGDTLSEISKTYDDNVTVAKLKEWNDLTSDLIITGQQLIVNGKDAGKVVIQEKPVKEESQKKAQTASSESESNETDGNLETKPSKKDIKPEKKEEASEQSEPEGRTFSVEATAYTAYCAGCSGITATGVNLKANPHAKVISVDPNVIPLGTEVYVEGYGYAVAADTGGAINGNRIDVHLPTKSEAYSWGRRTVTVTILE
ncbi:cell wall-binding protein [Virgibacillus indicus]|uniref:Cell wall-binding protein n=1 Tax=Virgibacillus indicus TaxID=2024554 RepID=A0A265NCX9_9BACI|nr:3D domain-containing protein [Virgibacillus indicus]OZU89667.1 cell wall-binding protein [Virgibacillus indicus]